jgi:hypothetical protein
MKKFRIKYLWQKLCNQWMEKEAMIESKDHDSALASFKYIWYAKLSAYGLADVEKAFQNDIKIVEVFQL